MPKAYADDLRTKFLEAYAAREQFEAAAVTPADARAGVLLKAPWKSGLTVIGAYFPWARPAKREFFAVCMDQASQHFDVPFLLVGALNTGRNDLDLETGAKFFPGTADFVAFTDTVSIDQWRAHHGTASDYSLWLRQNGFRSDHALGNTVFQTRYPPMSCNYDHSTRTSKLGDHSALILRVATSMPRLPVHPQS